MTAPTAQQLLDAWERAHARPAVQRPAVLLAAAGGVGDASAAEAECDRCSLGQRNARLLALRELTFGNQLHCLTECPQCQTAVEFSLTSGELRLSTPVDPGPIELTRDGWTLSVRLPTSADLVAAVGESDVAVGRRRLFACCLLSATRADGVRVGPDDVPDELVRAAGDRMGAADPQADPTFALRCPQCETGWEAPFDLGAYFWQELHTWAKRLLRDVHELALAYGWNETEILALSDARRAAYLQLLRA